MCLNLDLLTKKERTSLKKSSRISTKRSRYYNQNVWPQQHKSGDWVLTRANQNIRDPNHNVLGLNWEGSYRVLRAVRLGAYKLAYVDEWEVKRS